MRYFPTINDMFNDFFDDNTFFAPTSKMNNMLCDIRETADNYQMELELPGYKKEDIKINLEKGYLTVSASSNTEKEEKNKEGKVIRRERYSGNCSRSFYVGDNITVEDINAAFDNGELTITIPKVLPERVEEKKYIAIK